MMRHFRKMTLPTVWKLNWKRARLEAGRLVRRLWETTVKHEKQNAIWVPVPNTQGSSKGVGHKTAVFTCRPEAGSLTLLQARIQMAESYYLFLITCTKPRTSDI